MDKNTTAIVPDPGISKNANNGTHRTILLACAFALISVITSAPAFAQYSLTCASEDGHRHYCAADTRGGVSLQNQRSKSACVQGATWGFDQRGVWVDHGCRADFLVRTRQLDRAGDRHDRDYDHHSDFYRGRDHHAETMQLTCSSEDGRRHYCESPIQGTAVLVRQRSGSPCRQGYSWGNDRRGIWVDHGCRADFELRGR